MTMRNCSCSYKLFMGTCYVIATVFGLQQQYVYLFMYTNQLIWGPSQICTLPRLYEPSTFPLAQLPASMGLFLYKMYNLKVPLGLQNTFPHLLL